MRWKIWYSDGSTYSDEDGAWEDAPTRGVVVLSSDDEIVGRELDRGQPFYLWWPDAPKPWGVDYVGLWDYLVRVDHADLWVVGGAMDYDALSELGVKFGRSVDNVQYEELMKSAYADSYLEPKQGWTKSERDVLDRWPLDES